MSSSQDSGGGQPSSSNNPGAGAGGGQGQGGNQEDPLFQTDPTKLVPKSYLDLANLRSQTQAKQNRVSPEMYREWTVNWAHYNDWQKANLAATSSGASQEQASGSGSTTGGYQRFVNEDKWDDDEDKPLGSQVQDRQKGSSRGHNRQPKDRSSRDRPK